MSHSQGTTHLAFGDESDSFCRSKTIDAFANSAKLLTESIIYDLLKRTNTQHSDHIIGKYISNWIKGWKLFQESS